MLGIIGLGKIGFRLAQKAKTAFEMKVSYHDVVRFEGRERELGDVRWCATLEELLRTSDCVVLATPFEGQVLLKRKEFQMFKKGARLVNIARGKLIDEEALVEALDEGIVSAAGLDVHADEPNVNPKLAKRDNVMVLSMFTGFSTYGVSCANMLCRPHGWGECGEPCWVRAVGHGESDQLSWGRRGAYAGEFGVAQEERLR